MKAVNGIRAEDLAGTGLVVKQRYVLPLAVTVPFYLTGKLVHGVAGLVKWLVRVWRVSVPAGVLLAVYARFDLAGVLALIGVLAASGALWRVLSPISFTHHVTHRAYGTWRLWWVYRRRWASVMDGVGLSRTTESAVYVPQIVAVWSTRVVDTIHLRLLHGQTPADVAFVVEGLRHAFEAHRCVCNEIRPGRICLRFYTRDPLTKTVPALPVPAVSDLAELPVALAETGQTFRLHLTGTHVLIVGATGAGKGSVLWSILRALTPAIRAGLVQLTGLDPKGGMELWPGRPLFQYLAADRAEEMAQHLEAATARMIARRNRLRAAGIRLHTATPGDPTEIIVIDELAFLTAYLHDRKLKERIVAALSLLLTQGRAVGFIVIAAVQDPRKDVVSFRNLFPTRIGLRLAEESETEMVFGEEALNAGALCHLIPREYPGIAYVDMDGITEPVRVRFGWVTDTDITHLCALVTATAGQPVTEEPSDATTQLIEPLTLEPATDRRVIELPPAPRTNSETTGRDDTGRTA